MANVKRKPNNGDFLFFAGGRAPNNVRRRSTGSVPSQMPVVSQVLSCALSRSEPQLDEETARKIFFEALNHRDGVHAIHEVIQHFDERRAFEDNFGFVRNAAPDDQLIFLFS